MAPLYLVCGPDCANSDKCRIFVADGVFNRSHARSCCGLVPRPCVPFWRKGGIRGWPDSALRAHFCASGAFCGQKRIDGSADHIRAGLFYTRLAFQPRLDKFASRFSVYLPRRLERWNLCFCPAPDRQLFLPYMARQSGQVIEGRRHFRLWAAACPAWGLAWPCYPQGN